MRYPLQRFAHSVRAWRRDGADWFTAIRLAVSAAVPIAGGVIVSDKDPNVFAITPTSAAGGTSTVIPEVNVQGTTANLAGGATLNIDFLSGDTDMIYDGYIYADQAIQVLVFIRQSSTDTFQQLDAAVYATSIANQLTYVMKAQRLPGTQVRIQLKNNTPTATTVLSAQFHARSM